VSDEHGVAGGPDDHAEHGQPDVRHALRRLASVSDAQHVTHGLKEGEGVELGPRVVLFGGGETGGEDEWGGSKHEDTGGGGEEELSCVIVSSWNNYLYTTVQKFGVTEKCPYFSK